jgi:hypothetical protein
MKSALNTEVEVNSLCQYERQRQVEEGSDKYTLGIGEPISTELTPHPDRQRVR